MIRYISLLLFIGLVYWGCSLPKSERIIRLEQDGLHTEWYDNGQKKEETTYKNGKKMEYILNGMKMDRRRLNQLTKMVNWN